MGSQVGAAGRGGTPGPKGEQQGGKRQEQDLPRALQERNQQAGRGWQPDGRGHERLGAFLQSDLTRHEGSRCRDGDGHGREHEHVGGTGIDSDEDEREVHLDHEDGTTHDVQTERAPQPAPGSHKESLEREAHTRDGQVASRSPLDHVPECPAPEHRGGGRPSRDPHRAGEREGGQSNRESRGNSGHGRDGGTPRAVQDRERHRTRGQRQGAREQEDEPVGEDRRRAIGPVGRPQPQEPAGFSQCDQGQDGVHTCGGEAARNRGGDARTAVAGQEHPPGESGKRVAGQIRGGHPDDSRSNMQDRGGGGPPFEAAHDDGEQGHPGGPSQQAQQCPRSSRVGTRPDPHAHNRGFGSRQGERDVVSVLYLQPCSSFGGAERQASTAIPRLGAFGIDAVPLVGPNALICRWLEEQAVKGTILSRDFPGAWPAARGLGRLALPARYLRCQRQVAEQVEALLREGAFDLTFAAMPFSWVAATAASRRLGVPIVWRAGGTAVSATASVALRLWARLHPPDLLVCCGQAVRDVVGPLVPAPAVVVRSGVDLDMFRPGRGSPRALRPSWAAFVVGFAARLVPQKRPQDFIAMAARVTRRHPEVAFLIAGDGSRRADYERKARSAGFDRQMRFLGFVGDMTSFYAACDVVVLPSQSEGCPNVVLEAMAMQRALVVSHTPATAEVVSHGREALVYPVGDVDAFVASVTRLIESHDLRARLAAAARDRVRRDFEARGAAARLARVLRDAVARWGGTRGASLAAATRRAL